MSLLWYLIWLIFILWVIKRLKFFKNKYITTKQIYIIFLIKVAISFAVYGVYTTFYTDRTTSDMFKYYDDGKILYESLFNNPLDYIKMITGINDDEPQIQEYYNKMNFWIKPYKYEIINENRTLIRLNAFISLFSFNNYFIHALIFVFLSFIGLFAIFKVLSSYLNQHQKLFVYAVFLFPSVIFWSSAILKEALVFFNLGMALYFLEKIKNKFSIYSFFFFVIFMYLLLYSKIYVFMLTLPAITYILISKVFSKLNKVTIFVVIHFFYLITFFYSEKLTPYDFSNIIVTKQYHFIQMAKEFNAGSLIEIRKLDNSFLSFLLNTPQAIVNVLFRPFLWESHNILSLISAIENIFLILAILFCIIFFQPNYKNIWFWFSVSFCIHLIILIGLTTPVLGAIVRYKVPCLPFIMFIFFSIIDISKTYSKFLILWKKLF